MNVLRQIESAGRLEGNALEVTLRGDIAPRVSGMAQYVFGQTMADTGGVNWFPAASFAPQGEWGRADTDRRHQFNFLGTVSLHRWLNFGVSAFVLSGPPFNITTGRDDNRDGMAIDRPSAITRNTGSGPESIGLDLRWYREFRFEPSKKDKSPSDHIQRRCIQCSEPRELPELHRRAHVPVFRRGPSRRCHRGGCSWVCDFSSKEPVKTRCCS